MVRHVMLLASVSVLFAASSASASQNIVIVLDDSSSMTQKMRSTGRRIEVAKGALLHVLEQLPDDANVGLLLLNGSRNERWAIPLGPVDKDGLADAVRKIPASGHTPLGQCVKIAADELLKQREKQRYGTYKLLIVTDGEATDGARLDNYLPDILARGLVVDVIGVDMKRDHSLATRVHTYRRADDPTTLEKALTELVLSESVVNDDPAAESDYDLLAGLPNEVATAALQSLASMRNEPITIARPRPTYTPPTPARDAADSRSVLPPDRPASGDANRAAPFNVAAVLGVGLFMGIVVLIFVVASLKAK